MHGANASHQDAVQPARRHNARDRRSLCKPQLLHNAPTQVCFLIFLKISPSLILCKLLIINCAVNTVII